MAEVEAVLFDAGNTLVYADPCRMAELMGCVGVVTDTLAVTRAELVARRRLHALIANGHVGTEPEIWSEYFGTLFRESGVPEERLAEVGALLRETHAREHLWTHVEEDTAATLEELRREGYRLAVISNADGRIEALLERVGLRGPFEFVIDSEVVGIEKPDPRIFHEGCARLGLEPGRCLYVGDLYPVDFLGARAAGMESVLLDPLGLYGARAPTVAALAGLPAHLAAH